MTAALVGTMPVIAAVVAQNVFFYLIAAVMVIAALRVVTTSNIVHAALYLVVVLGGVASQFILLGAEFVGVTQVLVYIGAVIVLFLFGIMLTRAKVGSEEGLNQDNLLPAILTAVLLVVVMGYAVVDFASFEDVPSEIAGIAMIDGEIAPESEVRLLNSAGESISEAVTDVDGSYMFEDVDEGFYTVFLDDQDLQYANLSSPREIDVLGNNPTTVQQVSDSIFSTYIVAFESISVLLLAALIGAIVVARKE